MMCMWEGWFGRMGWTTLEAGGSHGTIVIMVLVAWTQVVAWTQEEAVKVMKSHIDIVQVQILDIVENRTNGIAFSLSEKGDKDSSQVLAWATGAIELPMVDLRKTGRGSGFFFF